MSKLDTNFVKQLYSSKGVELTPEKLQYISENYASNEELESSFNMKYSEPQEPKTDPEKKNQNSTTTSTKTPSVSPTQQRERKPTSVGGKPIQTGASASSAGKSEDLINRFGIKPGEKIAGVEKKAYEAQRNKPKVGTTKTQPVVSTKPVSENLTKKVEEKYDALSKIPAVTEKIEKQTKLTPDELLVISKQQDLVINQNYNPTLSEEKLKDELDEYQFLDGVSEGIRSSTNKFLLQPLTEVNKYFGGDKDFTIKKGIPLATEKEQAEKELIEEKGFGNFSKEEVSEKAKSIFLKNDELSQKINATDSYFSTLPDGHQVQRDLWIKTKADSLKSNEDIKKKAQLLQVNADRIQAYNDFIVGINEKGFASEEDKVKHNELLSLAQKAQEENDLLRKSYKNDLSKLEKDNEKLELLKFNYNDLEKSLDLWNKGVGTIVGGALKLIGETRELVFEETAGRLTGIDYEDPLSKAGDYVSSLGKEDVKQYRMMSLDDVNNWGDAGSWLGQLVIEQGPILAFMATGGGAGLEAVAMSSGGSKIQEMEDAEKQPFAKKYSQFEKVAAGWSYYGAEKYTEKFSTFKYLDDLKSSLKNISSSSRELAENSFKKETAKVIGSTLLQSQVEGASEAVTELSNSLTDIYLLDDKLSSNEISKRMKDAYASGVAIGGGMSVTGAFTTFASKELRAISDDKDISEVRGILGKLETINKEINSNLLLTDQDKTNLEKKANDLMNKATSIVAKSVDNIEKFSIEEISNLLDINKEQSELKTEFDNLRKSAMSSDLKKEEYDDLNKKFTTLEKKRNDIITGTYEEFNYLPEEEQTKLKVEAAEAIIQEQVDKGIEKDKIQEPNAEVINKKAKELYNQKTQEDAKTKQTDGQITSEEKPTTTTEEQTVSTAQQVDAGVQTQEEVRLTPKTETDAVQEQTTSEIPVQPETAISEEMEQGEPEAKPEESTEQSEEKVKLQPKNIRDLYKANRNLFGLDRIKSLSSAIVMDRMVGNMAKRAGIDKKEMYNKLKIEKASKAPKKSLKQENTPFDSNERAEKNISDMFEYLPYGDIKSFTNSIKIGDEDIVFDIYGEKMYLPNTVAKSLMGVISLNKEVFELTAGMRKEDISIYDKQFSSDKSYFEKLRGSIIKSLNDSKDLYEKRLSKKMDSQLSEGDVGFEEIQKISKKIDMVNSFLSKIESEYFTPNEITVKHKGNTVLFQKSKGAMLAEDGSFIIYALTDPNVSTPLHEMAHVFEHYLSEKEKSIIIKEAGTNGWTVDTSEYFARGFEKYLSEGIAPTKALQKIFDLFKEWLLDIYNGIKGSDIDIKLNKPMKKLYDSMVSDVDAKSKVKLQEEVKKASDRLSKAYDAYKNIGIVFDPEGNWKKDKELVSSLVEFAVSNIKFGAYNAKVLIEDLAKKGIEISKENAKYIFDKANKKFKSDINKAVGIKPKATEQKRIDKAFGVGVATQKVETQAQKEKVKSAKEELSTAKKEIQDVFSAAKEALKIEKDRNKVINKLKVDANAFIKASITDLKAGDIGNRAITSIASKIQSIADQNFEEKLLEINTVLDNLYTNRDINTAKADSKKAFANVMSGKVGKLDKRGDRDKVMSSKIVNFTKLEPKTLKKVVDIAIGKIDSLRAEEQKELINEIPNAKNALTNGKVDKNKLTTKEDKDKFDEIYDKYDKLIVTEADFEQYKDYISRLSGRGLTLEETDLPTIEKIFDKLVKPYSDYVAEVNRIQQIIDAGGTLTKDESDFIENNSSDFSERETPEKLADKEEKKSERDAKKEEEIAKKKASIKELLPSIKSVFESSNAVKGSLEWRMLNSLMGLSESDVDSMPDNMLTNALNAISSMANDDVIPAYAEDLYKYKLKTDYKNALVETLKKSGKAGVYKLKVAKIPLKLREVIGLPLMSLIKGINQKNIDQQVIDRRIKFFNLSAMDAAVKIYGDTPLFNAFMSSFGKAMSRIASSEEKVEAVLLRAKRDIDKNSKNPQESYMKIVYHLIDTMAKNNVGTTSSISAMEYFEATVSDPNSKISEDNYMKGLVNGFIDKVKENDNQIEDLTPEEANAANAIRMVLEENQINAYEANLFQNSNAAPMIVEYYPVFNSVVKQAENDLARLKSKFGIDSVSIKAGNLEDKTGTAHPIDLNPFTSAFSSVRNVLFQHQLRSEYASITQAINEAIAENSKDNDVLPYLKGIQKALNSQFDLLINGAVHTEPTLTDKILNGTDRAFYTLALGSIISRGVDFAGNMVQLMTINPKYILYSNKVSNTLINIKEDGESETELIRSFYENAEASDVNKMISSKKINTERTEFINRGINKEVLSKGLPSSNAGVKLRAKITGPIRDTASGAVDTLLGFGDVKPYAISWNGVFYEEFLKQTGEDVNVEKIARGDVEYLKKYKDAISKASNKANQENADLYGSTNPMEKKVGIMEIASKQVKNSVPGAFNALVNKAAYLFASFDMNARNDMNTAVNTYIENKEGRNARRFLGGAIRLASYSLAINYITGAIWGLFKGDDDDEEKLKVSFDKLSGDDDFIKEVNNSLLDYPIQKDADGNIIELTREDLAKYNKMRDKLMQNKDFAAAYDIVYGYVNRDLFDNQVKNKIGEINSGKYEYDKSLVEVFFSDMDKGFGKSDDEIIGVLGLLNSQQGYKLFTQDQIDSYILKLEKYMSDTKLLSNRAIRESNKQIDRLIITKTASILSDYRSNKSIGDITTTEGLKLFMGMMLSRSNNFTKAAYNYAAELSNKQLIQARRGERGYDAFKDNVFQTPVKAGLTEKASKQQLTQDVFNILFPALTKMDRYMATDYAIPDLVRFTPLGILGVNDFSKIDSKMRNDVIYQNTNGKYRENIIKDIEESKIDILRSKEDIEKDSTDNQFRKSRVIPGVKETQLKSRFPSYKEGKDLKVNGNRAN